MLNIPTEASTATISAITPQVIESLNNTYNLSTSFLFFIFDIDGKYGIFY